MAMQLILSYKKNKKALDTHYYAQKIHGIDHILIMNGDMPLVTEDIIEQLIQKHYESNASITFVTAHNC